MGGGRLGMRRPVAQDAVPSANQKKQGGGQVDFRRHVAFGGQNTIAKRTGCESRMGKTERALKGKKA